MNVRSATVHDKERWNAFVFSSPQASFLQTWEWGEVQQTFGTKIWRLIIGSEEKIEGVALVLRRELPLGRCWLYVPRGPSFAPPSAGAMDGKPIWSVLIAKLKDIAEEEHAIFVRVDPSVAPPAAGAMGSAFRKAEREVQPQHTLLLDLTKSEEELLAGMKSKTRYNVRLAERKGVQVRFSKDAADVDIFLELSRGVSDRSGFRYHPDEYYRAIISNMDAELAIAEYNGEPLAAHLMIYAGEIATYAHGTSSDTMRELMAPQYVYWQTILRAKERGMKVYDFFGVAPEAAGPDPASTAGRHPWAGMTRIKEGFGGRRVSYIGAYDLVLEPGLYHMFNTVKRVKGLLK